MTALAWLMLFAPCWEMAAQTGSTPEAEQLRAARDLRRTGQTDRALQQLAAILRGPGHGNGTPAFEAEVLREMGEVYLERKEFSPAADCLERSLASDPAPGGVHYELGLAYRGLGDHRKAAAHFESAIEKGFRNLGASYNLTEAYFASRQSAAALNTARQIMLAAPKSADLMLRLGRLLFERLYYREAVNVFRLAHESAPDAFEPRFYLALTEYLLGHYEEVIRLLPEQASLANPETANLVAASLAAAGDPDKAALLLRQTLARDPRSPHAYLNLALIRLEQEQPLAAEKLLDDLRTLGSSQDAKVFYSVRRYSCPELVNAIRANAPVPVARDKADFYFNLASQMQNRYHYASAVALLSLARLYEGNSGRLLYAAGMNCLNLSPQGPEAIALLRAAVTLDPHHHEAWYLLGRARLRQGNTDQAIAAFRQALALEPRAPYWISLGKTLLSAGTPDPHTAQRDARAAFLNALALEPSNALAHYEAGRLFHQLEDFSLARTHLERAVELEPDFFEAYYLLSRVCSRTGDRAQSQKYLALFERTKRAAQEQSVVSSGYAGEGLEP